MRGLRKMNYPVYAMLLLVLLTSTSAPAASKTNETYDGTINSFRWLKRPMPVNHVLIQNDRGEQVGLSQFNGKIVLLNLWASWCKPCIEELPALDRLQDRLSGRDFVIVTIALDEDIDEARQMFFDTLSIQSMGFYHESTERLGRDFPVDIVPASFLIDREGRAVGFLRSSIGWAEPDADTLIKRLIAGVSPATLEAEKQQ